MELKIIDGLFETRAVNADKRSVDAVMSTQALDRYNERIAHDAWEKRLARFRSSPVLLRDHDHTKPIGHWENVRVSKEGLVGTAVFATTPEAEERFALHRDGHVKSFSVGFIPYKWAYKDDVVEGQSMRVKVYEDCELLECSSVAIGANPEALQRLMRTYNAIHEDASIESVIESAVERKLKQFFHAGPGGPLAQLALDIAELTGHRSPGDEDGYGDIHPPEVPDPGSLTGDEPGSEEGDEELKALLQDALGKAE